LRCVVEVFETLISPERGSFEVTECDLKECPDPARCTPLPSRCSARKTYTFMFTNQ